MAAIYVQKYGVFLGNQHPRPRAGFIMGLNEENLEYCKIPKCTTLG